MALSTFTWYNYLPIHPGACFFKSQKETGGINFNKSFFSLD